MVRPVKDLPRSAHIPPGVQTSIGLGKSPKEMSMSKHTEVNGSLFDDDAAHFLTEDMWWDIVAFCHETDGFEADFDQDTEKWFISFGGGK
jgi:hypothetical protein